MRAQVALLGSLLLLCALLALMPGTPRPFALAETNKNGPGGTTPKAPTARRAPSPLAAGSADAKIAPELPSGPQPFDPAQVRLPETSVERQMLRALTAKDTAAAVQIGDQALATADPATRGRVLWLLARALSGTPQGDAKLGMLTTIAHPLARWAGLRLAERLLLQDPGESLRIGKELSARWAGAFRARVVVALAHYRAGHSQQAEPLLRALLEGTNKRAPGANFALPLAEILSTRKEAAALREALALCRRVSARAPTQDVAAQADKLAATILTRMSAKDRAAFGRPSAEDDFARGQALMASREYEKAQKVLDAAAKRAKRDPELRCKIELEAGKALFQQRKVEHRRAAAKRLHGVAVRCKEAEVKAWARYQAASAHQRAGEPGPAITEYEALVRELPQHSLADDALYLQAFAKQDAGDPAGMRASLTRLLDRYPNGDQRAEARFALAMEARGRGDLHAALAQLDLLVDEGANEKAEGYEGRAAYWRARALQDLGRTAEAAAAFAELTLNVPLTYHAQQAIARLREIDGAQAQALLVELGRPEPALERLTFPWRVEFETPSFRSALELLRVDEAELAERELSYLGALGDGADPDLLWLTAALYYESESYADASNLARSRLRAFKSEPPRGRARFLWRIAYPRAFEPLIEQAAQEMQVPPEFVRAVAREESNFNPEAVSAALAYGLIQLIRPTARGHAAALGLPSDPDALKRPEINLRIGSHFIRELWQRYLPNPAVVPAAYNAGYAAADKWLRESKSYALDEWIERIPYRETRRYTRRVLQTYGIYSWLDTGKLPDLPRTPPPAPPM